MGHDGAVQLDLLTHPSLGSPGVSQPSRHQHGASGHCSDFKQARVTSPHTSGTGRNPQSYQPGVTAGISGSESFIRTQ